MHLTAKHFNLEKALAFKTFVFYFILFLLKTNIYILVFNILLMCFILTN